MRLLRLRGGCAALALSLLGACGDASDRPSVGTDSTPTSPSSAPLPSADSAPGGGGGGPSAGDPIGTGEP